MKRRYCLFALAVCLSVTAAAWEHWGGNAGGTRVRPDDNASGKIE